MFCTGFFILIISLANTFNINGHSINSGKTAGKQKNKNMTSIGNCQNAQMKYVLITVKILVRKSTTKLVNIDFLFLQRMYVWNNAPIKKVIEPKKRINPISSIIGLDSCSIKCLVSN